MPDFERLTDKLAIDMAKTPEHRAWVEGWIAGKKLARRQVAIAIAFIVVLVAVVAAHMGA